MEKPIRPPAGPERRELLALILSFENPPSLLMTLKGGFLSKC